MQLGGTLSCLLLLDETTISAERRMEHEGHGTGFWVSPRPLGVWAQSKFTDKLWHTDSVTLMASI